MRKKPSQNFCGHFSLKLASPHSRCWMWTRFPGLRCGKVFSQSSSDGRGSVSPRQPVEDVDQESRRKYEVSGIGSRPSFLKHDLTKPLNSKVQYDLVVSNLVFHNLGRKRFQAYRTVFDALKAGGYFIIGDVSRNDEADVDYFREHAALIKELDEGNSGGWVYKIRILRK